MVEILLSNDPVLLSYCMSLLRQAGYSPMLMDRHMSLLEGSLALLPSRLMVVEDELVGARQLLEGVGLAAQLVDPDRGQ